MRRHLTDNGNPVVERVGFQRFLFGNPFPSWLNLHALNGLIIERKLLAGSPGVVQTIKLEGTQLTFRFPAV